MKKIKNLVCDYIGGKDYDIIKTENEIGVTFRVYFLCQDKFIGTKYYCLSK